MHGRAGPLPTGGLCGGQGTGVPTETGGVQSNAGCSQQRSPQRGQSPCGDGGKAGTAAQGNKVSREHGSGARPGRSAAGSPTRPLLGIREYADAMHC